MLTNKLLNLFQQVGYAFMIPLAGLSIVSLGVVLERIYILATRTILKSTVQSDIQTAAQKNDLSGLESLVAKDNTFTGLILADSLKNFKVRNGSITLEQAVESSTEKHIDWLSRKLWILRAIGHIAPLLGLMSAGRSVPDPLWPTPSFWRDSAASGRRLDQANRHPRKSVGQKRTIDRSNGAMVSTSPPMYGL